MRTMVFTYNFSHKKSCDFLFQMLLKGYKVEFVAAADPVKVDRPNAVLRSSIRHRALSHPREVCERFGVPYFVVQHNSHETVDLLQQNNIVTRGKLLDTMMSQSILFPDFLKGLGFLGSTYLNVEEWKSEVKFKNIKKES